MPDTAAGAHEASPAELKARIEFERRGTPFVVYRVEGGAQVIMDLESQGAPITIGRRADNDVALTWDVEVSRVHAQLERVGGDWTLTDDGLSRNGTWVNGERIQGRRRLHDGDRMCFGETPVTYRSPPDEDPESTVTVKVGVASIPLTDVQRRVLIALCRPLKESAYAPPATNREIAEGLVLSVDAVKGHLRVLFQRFGLEELPQNRKRARLAGLALIGGLVSEHDF
jgi:pSer/pThr/pTyr-binding forkhead associated (FHA) protein